MNQWATLLLSVPMQFEVHGTMEKLYFSAISKRESTGSDYDILFRSAVQRIYELAAYRDSISGPKLKHQQIAERWKHNIKFSTMILDQYRF